MFCNINMCCITSSIARIWILNLRVWDPGTRSGSTCPNFCVVLNTNGYAVFWYMPLFLRHFLRVFFILPYQLSMCENVWKLAEVYVNEIVGNISVFLSYTHDHFILHLTSLSVAGLTVNKEPVVGVIYNPILDQMYHARKGHGAFMNDEKITVSGETGRQRLATVSGFWNVRAVFDLWCVTLSFGRNRYLYFAETFRFKRLEKFAYFVNDVAVM